MTESAAAAATAIGKTDQSMLCCFLQNALIPNSKLPVLLTIVWVHAHLHIAASTLHPHLPNDSERRIPKPLVLLISQGLSGCHGNRVTGVYPHGVYVLDGAHYHAVVVEVAHNLELVLLPADKRLLHQDLWQEQQQQQQQHTRLREKVVQGLRMKKGVKKVEEKGAVEVVGECS